MALTRKCRTFYRSGPKKGRCKEWGPWRKASKKRRLKRTASSSTTSTRRFKRKKAKKGGRKCTFYGLVKTSRGPRWACARRSGRKHSGPKSPNWMGVPIPAARYKEMKKARAAAKKAAKATQKARTASSGPAVAYPWPFKGNPYAGGGSSAYANVGAGMSARAKAQARKAAQGLRF